MLKHNLIKDIFIINFRRKVQKEVRLFSHHHISVCFFSKHIPIDQSFGKFPIGFIELNRSLLFCLRSNGNITLTTTSDKKKKRKLVENARIIEISVFFSIKVLPCMTQYIVLFFVYVCQDRRRAWRKQNTREWMMPRFPGTKEEEEDDDDDCCCLLLKVIVFSSFSSSSSFILLLFWRVADNKRTRWTLVNLSRMMTISRRLIRIQRHIFDSITNMTYRCHTYCKMIR